ncbi:MAG: cation efflux protein, partial [Linnemannia elongata]
ISLEALRESEKDKRRLKIAIGLCSTFFVVELLGGLWAESLALLSDSFHLLTDITSFIISLVAIYLSHRPSTATHTFGYHRAEVLGALFSIFLIWGLTLLLIIEAYERVKHPIDVDGKTMSIVAGLGVFVNIVYHGHSHAGHSHSHGHHHHVNLNITAATLHVLGDLLSSIGVLISSLIISFYPSMTYLDPICTFIFSFLVILTTIGIFKRSIAILMERAPRGINTEEVKEAICDIPGVLDVKSLHIWSLTIGQPVLAGTVYLQPEVQEVKKAAAIIARTRSMIRKRYNIRQCTLQIE